MKNVQRYLRGQVWHVNIEDLQVEQGVIAKSRPCVILSNNHNNSYFNSIIVLPISSSSNNCKRSNSYAYKYKNLDVCVMCDQIKTVNVHRLTDYMYTMSEQTMKEVEAVLCKVLAIGTDDLDDTDEIEPIINDIETSVNEAAATLNHIITAPAIDNLIKPKIEPVVFVPRQPQVKQEVILPITPIEPIVEKPVIVPIKSEGVTRTPVKKQYKFDKDKFVKYYEEFGINKTMNEYGMGRSTIYTHVRNIKAENLEIDPVVFTEEYIRVDTNVLVEKYNKSAKELADIYNNIVNGDNQEETTDESSEEVEGGTVRYRKWAIEQQLEFLNWYDANGVSMTMKKYRMTRNQVMKARKKFMSNINMPKHG